MSLEAQLAFLLEADRLKGVDRATPVIHSDRRENSAEHSWHLGLYALILGGHAGPDVDVNRVIRMLLIHDIVEIDAGDTPIHGGGDPTAQEAKEQAAATRLFGLLPGAQGAELLTLWQEFEAAETPDARFAKSLDRAQPVLTNLAADGGTWTEYNVDMERMEDRVLSRIRRGFPALADFLTPRVTAWFANR